MARKFREARPLLKKTSSSLQTLAFTIDRRNGDPYEPDIQPSWVVKVISNADPAIFWQSEGDLTISSERTKGRKYWKSIVVQLRYMGPMEKDSAAPADDEEVTISAGPSAGTQSDVNDDTDVVIDLP